MPRPGILYYVSVALSEFHSPFQSAAPEESTEDGETDTEPNYLRGRPSAPTPLANFTGSQPEPRLSVNRGRLHSNRRTESLNRRSPSVSRVKSPARPSFLQPVQVIGLPGPSSHLLNGQRTPLPPLVSLFRDRFSIDISTPFHGGDFVFSVPTGQALEMLLLIMSLLYAQYKISNGYKEELPLAIGSLHNDFVVSSLLNI